MRKSLFTEAQIIGLIKEQDAGMPIGGQNCVPIDIFKAFRLLTLDATGPAKTMPSEYAAPTR